MKIAVWGNELTAWSSYFELMLKQMKSPVFVDGCNIFSRELVEILDLTCYGIGK